MTTSPTIGMRLLSLKERSGMSLSTIAEAAGYRASSSIQKLFKPSYNPQRLQLSVAERLAAVFDGRGDPTIDKSELLALAGKGEELDKLVATVRHYSYRASAFIGIHRTNRIDQFLERDDGAKLQLFARETAPNGILYHPCPPHLRSRGIVGLYVTVGNMWPRFEEGEPIFYEHHKPPSQGDDVLVSVASEELDGAMLIGRLRLSSETEIQVDQLSPAGCIVIPREKVISLRRLMHTADFLEAGAYARIGLTSVYAERTAD